VFAEWTRVDGNRDATAYVDLHSIQKKGSKVRMWRLFDFSTIMIDQGYKYQSSVTHHEYDCEALTARMLDISLYSGNMESGIAIYVNNNINDQPSSIIPRTILNNLLKIACSKT
jgi:hypothetical protein